MLSTSVQIRAPSFQWVSMLLNNHSLSHLLRWLFHIFFFFLKPLIPPEVHSQLVTLTLLCISLRKYSQENPHKLAPPYTSIMHQPFPSFLWLNFHAPIQGQRLYLGTRSYHWNQLKTLLQQFLPIPPASSVFSYLLNHSHKHITMLLLFPS